MFVIHIVKTRQNLRQYFVFCPTAISKIWNTNYPNIPNHPEQVHRHDLDNHVINDITGKYVYTSCLCVDRFIKQLLDETDSNIRFVLPWQVMFEAKLSLTSLDPGKTNLMLDSVSSNNCIIPKHTIGSNQLQIQQRTVSLFASACLIL